ncbi:MULTISPECIES: hypothetical protein [unclassified Burkholderia]|nr:MULTISPECIES: hypothetical protein [unclassified Burkholderia]
MNQSISTSDNAAAYGALRLRVALGRRSQRFAPDVACHGEATT